MNKAKKLLENKLFRFINGNKCNTYYNLLDYCKKNKLPLYPRWVFYFFGKKKFSPQPRKKILKKKKIDEDSPFFSALYSRKRILKKNKMDNDSQYGFFQYREVYYWDEFLRNEIAEKNYIKETLINLSYNTTDDLIEKVFIKRGWDYVSSEVDLELQNEKSRDEWKAMRDYVPPSEIKYPEMFDNYCDACNENPCACSSRDN